MSRRLQWQYAVLLERRSVRPRRPGDRQERRQRQCRADRAEPIITKDFEEVTLDGVKMVFQNTPDTEAPVEMNTWFPQFKAFWAAENITGTIHNIYTLRGAPVRNALELVEADQRALYKCSARKPR
jgi:alkyl sulfatase BDS1-like metallo-beta-lactamase superfamily hydrolase